jgi:hypothetical protein
MASIGLVILALALAFTAVRVFQVTDLHHWKRKLRHHARKVGSAFVVALLIAALLLGWVGLHGTGVL